MIEVTIDTFKRGFTAYYSNKDAMLSLITKHPEFNAAFGFMISSQGPIELGPNRKAWKNWDYKTAFEHVFVTAQNEWELCFFIEGEHLHCTEYLDVPEIKETGKPYSPAESRKTREWKEEHGPCIFRASFRQIEIDLGKIPEGKP
jgi:hypothetical protein